MTTTSRLRRFWQQIPLQRLQQGATLTIRSQIPIDVRIEPAWRESGVVNYERFHDDTAAAFQLQVSQDQTKLTSLGRETPWVVLDVIKSNDTHPQIIPSSTPPDATFDAVPKAMPKPIHKLMHHDGTLTQTNNIPDNVSDHNHRVDYYDGVAHLPSTAPEPEEASQQPNTVLRIQTPEKINLDCQMQAGGNIVVVDKLEGDITCQGSSQIHVKKLRGHTINLSSEGPVVVTELLEAQTLTVDSKTRLRAKQIHANVGTIRVDTTQNTDGILQDSLESEDDEGSVVDVSSMFLSGGSGCGGTVRVKTDQKLARRAVRIKSHHGPLQVQVDANNTPKESNPFSGNHYPLIELGGVNGSCEVTAKCATDGPAAWNSCAVHLDSLSPDTISVVTTNLGNIGLTVDRKVEADLRFVSLPSDEYVDETAALLAEEDDADMVVRVLDQLPDVGQPHDSENSRICIETDRFQEKRAVRNQFEFVEGTVENKSQEPDSRFDQKTRGGSIGKIRVEAAAAQAMDRFEGNDTEHLDRPLMAVVGTSGIRVETVSWLGAIARRYGLDDQSKRELGRTASRRGRPIV